MTIFTTEEERAAFLAKLKLIWQPDENSFGVNDTQETSRLDCHFKLSGNGVHFFVNQVHLFQGNAYETPAKLSCEVHNGKAEIIAREAYKGDPRYKAEWERDKAFADEWRATFRRNCWLSGFEIECTLHEQIEWDRWLKGEVTKDRWTRIWKPERIHRWNWEEGHSTFNFMASLPGGLRVMLFIEDRLTYGTLSPESGDGFLTVNRDRTIGQPLYRHNPQEMEGQEEFLATQKAFADKWLPVFRRNMWLSGSAIEHNVHEEQEWTLWLKEQQSNP